MQNTTLAYKHWLNDAFIDIAKKALQVIASNHNLAVNIYISFYTNHSQTIISKHVLKQYPEKITIVLENDFQNLTIKEDGFSINLSFSGKRENIYIPFKALISFHDVTHNISLTFKAEDKQKTSASKSNNIIKFTQKKD